MDGEAQNGRFADSLHVVQMTHRRRILRLAKHWPWTDVITAALTRREALPNPG
ncbi:hypothetical protein [Streptomyces sp. SP18BB07]|uniref:hypothetical protein n=1 Tax=Streptomyces sp. SP18BB07 TaxID=3002522 RepID=UPI002E78BAB6|nr:hypothetical protein [Streptomyces sp. SP18BB07]